MTELVDPCADRVERYLDRAGLRGAHTHVLQGDASTRQYVRVSTPDRGSQILLVHPEAFDPDTLDFLNVAGLMERMEVRVPTVIRQEADLGILVLQDLGDVTLQRRMENVTAEERDVRYTEAVGLIDQMQRRALALASPRYAPFGLAFDVEKLTWELDFFVQHFLVAHRSSTMTSDRRTVLMEEFSLLVSELAAEPPVFCHRDYHSRNLMVHAGDLYVIDFQDARMGPDTYDLVSLLRDSYIDHGTDFVDTMVNVYLDFAPPANSLEFRRRFDLMSVQRHLKALGTFGYQTTVTRTSRYHDAIPTTLGYLAQVFGRYSRFDRLRAALATDMPEIG